MEMQNPPALLVQTVAGQGWKLEMIAGWMMRALGPAVNFGGFSTLTVCLGQR